MKTTVLAPATLFTVFLACSPATEVREPAQAPVSPVVEPAPTAQSEPAATAPAEPAPEPSPEELKKAEELKKLNEDFAAARAAHEAELARLTPEIRAEAKALAEKRHTNGREAIAAAMKGRHRKPGNPERDVQRHPVDTLAFFGLRPNQTVIEYGPGEGWYTELLAPTLASSGKLYVTMTDPNGPRDQRATLYGERTRLFLERLPEAYGKVGTIVIDPRAPKLGMEGTADLVLAIRSLHGMHNNGTLSAWLTEFHRALKPKGVLGIVQHRAPADANPDESSKKGYLPERWVIEQVEAAGFKLAQKSELNANPRDTKDHPEGVWSLPPTLRQGDTDREKYVAIGESDRMTLKFVKP
ncbi:MAG TPA: methyltransferase domain-containing protein [Polyangiaceae bacterium]|nr:methyltransferase domain-containing protein [Polyangiaceae bacterium]